MEHAVTEMPLILFTTFCAVGAGSFVSLAVAWCAAGYNEKQLPSLGRVTAIPIAFVAVGFVCAFFHLANSRHALGVFAGVGASPLSNEIAAGCIFFAAAVVLCVLSLSVKVKAPIKKLLIIVTAALGILFAVFMGTAYMIDTIPSWNTIASPVQMVGYALLGGTALGMAVLSISGNSDVAVKMPFNGWVIGLAVGGTLASVIGLAMQFAETSALSNAMMTGADLADGLKMYLVFAIVCLSASCVCTVLAAMRRRNTRIFAWVAVAFAMTGVFFGRLVFYALEFSVGPIL